MRDNQNQERQLLSQFILGQKDPLSEQKQCQNKEIHLNGNIFRQRLNSLWIKFVVLM